MLLPYIPTVGLAVSSAVIVIAIFRWANATISPQLRDRIGLWLMGEPGAATWHVPVLTAIDRIFGTRALSLHRFVAIIIETTLAAAGAYLWRNVYIVDRTWATMALSWSELRTYSAILFFFAVPVQLMGWNFTIWSLHRMLPWRQFWGAICTPLVDFIALTVVYIFWNNIVLLPRALLYGGYVKSTLLAKYAAYLDDNYWVVNYVGPINILTMTPLLWVVVACAVAIAAQSARSVSIRFGKISHWLDPKRIEQEPLQLIGEITAALLFLIILAFGPFRPNAG